MVGFKDAVILTFSGNEDQLSITDMVNIAIFFIFSVVYSHAHLVIGVHIHHITG